MEMRCLRKLLGITYRDHISNEEVRNRTRQSIGPHEDLLTTVKKRKLRWYGHITRSSGLAKTIMQGTVQGGRRRGRQKKRWEDNIPEWTGLTLGAAMRKAERREEWKELVARLSVAPNGPLRLRDRQAKNMLNNDTQCRKEFLYSLVWLQLFEHVPCYLYHRHSSWVENRDCS